jgi:hypothetical protein
MARTGRPRTDRDRTGRAGGGLADINPLKAAGSFEQSDGDVDAVGEEALAVSDLLLVSA